MTDPRPTLIEINALNRDAFVVALGAAFELSPWVMERVHQAQPFANIQALRLAASAVLTSATAEERLALARAHPELAGKATIADELTEFSRREQAGAGLGALTPEEFARFHVLNAAYRERFGFPFIICVRLNTKASILDAMARRLDHTPEAELAEAMTQVGLIGGLRLADMVRSPAQDGDAHGL